MVKYIGICKEEGCVECGGKFDRKMGYDLEDACFALGGSVVITNNEDEPCEECFLKCKCPASSASDTTTQDSLGRS